MKIYVHNYLEPLVINSDLYEEKHSDQIGNAFGLSEHHYLSDVNLDYWIWKNSGEDIIGKAQYRKCFLNEDNKKYERRELESIFKNVDIMINLTKSNIAGHRCLNYLAYSFAHASFDLRLAIQIMDKIYGNTRRDGLDSNTFTGYLNNSEDLVYANLFVAKKEIIFEYYKWMFPILEEFCVRSGFRYYPDKYQQRAPGYIAERLFSFWCLHSNIKIYETNYSGEKFAIQRG